jgi:hypothetical protein
VSKFEYVLAQTRHMESHKLSSFDGRRVGWSLTSPVVMYTGIVYGWRTDSLACGIMWKTYTRDRCDPAQLFDCCHELWPLVSPSWLTCVVLLGYFPRKDVNWLESSWNPRIWVILACCSHSVDVHFIYVHMRFMFMLIRWLLGSRRLMILKYVDWDILHA